MIHYCPKCMYNHTNLVSIASPGRCPNCGEQLSKSLPNQELKKDAGKPRMDLIPSEVMIELAKVLTFGLNKGYKEESWKDVESYRYIAALYRHMTAWRLGEQVDTESKIHHLSHALCNVAFLLWKDLHAKR